MLFGVHAAVCCLGNFRQNYREHAAAALIAGLFVFQYKVLMAGDPVLGVVMTQHQNSTRYQDSMSSVDTLTGHGLMLLAWRFRARVIASQTLLPIFALGAWSMLLIHHSRFPHITPMMPKHFTRGYTFVGSGLLFFAWLQHLANRRPRMARTLSAAALLCVPLSLPDNISFVVDQYRVPPDPPLLVWQTETQQLLAYLRSRPGHMRILSDETVISRQICAMTNHLTIVSAGLVTPEFDERIARIRRFLNDPSDRSPLGDWQVDGVLLPKSRSASRRRFAADGRWQLAFENAQWGLFVRAP
jgi:hypothetical protein